MMSISCGGKIYQVQKFKVVSSFNIPGEAI